MAGFQIIDIFFGKFAVSIKGTGPEINSAVCIVGMALIDQCLDHIDHAADLFSGFRMMGGFLHIQTFHILLGLFDKTLRNDRSIHALFIGLFDDLIVHICKIGHIIHIITLILEVTADRIKYDHGTGISNMDVIIYGGAAYIHPDLARFHRFKIFLFPCHSVIYFHFQSFPPVCYTISLINICSNGWIP